MMQIGQRVTDGEASGQIIRVQRYVGGDGHRREDLYIDWSRTLVLNPTLDR